MGEEFQSYLTTPQQIGKVLLNAKFFTSIPTEGQEQYNDFFSFTDEVIPLVSEELTKRCGGTSFIPYLDIKKKYFVTLKESNFLVNADFGLVLFLRDFLLEADEIIWDTTTLVDGTDFVVMPGDYYPYTYINFADSISSVVGRDFGTFVSIEGFWGYHKSSSQLYQATADTAITLADSTVASITVAAITAYERYQYLRIENELLLITNRAGTALTVIRGVNGTTAIAHTAKPITIVKPMRDIQSLAAYVVAHNWQNRNLTTSIIQVGDIGIEIPQLMPRFTSTIRHYLQLQQSLFMGAI